MYVRCHVKYPLLLSDGNETKFLDTVLKNPHIRDIMKIRPVGPELFLSDRETDGWTDRYYEANSR